ncbi:MAG: HD superfamily phosphohydrolase [Candidatus Methanohalarchaeum thermophilum]|uniref:HD superfamily phosphohydrolase n=1 Tax=Methanohalarchaeum thermophilum TaxID=1903181 RepID=A0A1Q6DXR1_METT1|nr:MAG: HD superfamily phosphohydrolase [Candidatus Methanohalarchaeum thermophilum]
MSKIIKDPIHDYIKLNDLGLKLVDTHQLQRLRRVRQLGFSYLVYPGANHTRFEHSLGVYHLATEVCENLGLSQKVKKELQAAALLHDIGHGPFSHTSEEIISNAGGKTHEDFALDKIKDSNLNNILKEEDIDVSSVLKLIKGEKKFGKIISGELDVDRMDYLVRDAHYTGVAYGTIDYGRLINEIKIIDGEPILEEGGLQAAESLLVSRFLMEPTVYFHHTSRIAETMASAAIEKSLEKGLFTTRDFRRMFDHQVLLKMRTQEGFIGNIAERLLDRKLYKVAFKRNISSLDQDFIDKLARDQEMRNNLEKEISNEVGVEKEDRVLIDVPPNPRIDELKTNILIDGAVKRLDEVSNIVSILNDSRRDYWEIGVYSPKYKLGKAKDIVEKKLGS